MRLTVRCVHYGHRRTIHEMKSCGCEAELITLPGKGHAMIGSATETRALMAFWAQRLMRRPTDAQFIEVEGH